jgi:hypothetical protein
MRVEGFCGIERSVAAGWQALLVSHCFEGVNRQTAKPPSEEGGSPS